MKKFIFTFITAFLLTAILTTGCATGSDSINFTKETQEEFNQDAIYFIETDGAKLMKYLDNDTTISQRDKQPSRRRYNNLIIIINQNKQ